MVEKNEKIDKIYEHKPIAMLSLLKWVVWSKPTLVGTRLWWLIHSGAHGYYIGESIAYSRDSFVFQS